MFNKGHVAAEQILGGLREANNQIIANAQMKRALQQHRGSIALLATALDALRNAVPDHPLNSRLVQDRINALGEQTPSFQAAWRFECDAESIRAALLIEHERAREVTLAAIERAPITSKTKGWFVSREVFYFAKTEHDHEAAAVATKEKAGALARASQLDDTIDFESIVKAATRYVAAALAANSKPVEVAPEIVLAAPRPGRTAPYPFGRRRM